MIEMRWLVYEDEELIPNDVYGMWVGKPVTTKTVLKKKLQYRQQYDPTIYAGLNPFPAMQSNKVWSEWRDVPEVMNE